MRGPYCFGLWASSIVYSISLLGTLLLANERIRTWAVLLLIAAAVLAVLLWRRQKWIPAFPPDNVNIRRANDKRRRFFYLLGLVTAFVVVLAADLCYSVAPNKTFGLAGVLWLAGIGLLLWSAFFGAHSVPVPSTEPQPTCRPIWEIALVTGLFFVALLTRVWKLKNFPDNIYPDEIMTGTVASQAYISPTGPPPSVFSTLWSGIDLPALWFWIVAVFLKLGGNSLAMLRLPAALFGAATVLPLYGLIRGTWGRSAAIAGTAIMAFSASNVHYSRLALSNIVTQFFWATCFFFLLRGLRSRRPSDCALAGLAAGLSEYFYYGTRLLPFILLMFIVFVLALHWQQARNYLSCFMLLVGSYFVGFGPLLFHFIRNPNLYLGRGASLLIWSPHIPTSFADLKNAWNTVWPVFSENLLGISTHSSQDIIFYAPLLLPAEAALLVLGVALLLLHWRHPAAFLMLSSGLGVLIAGGTLVAYSNSVPPLINHWTPAFPAFYVTLAVPVGAWATVVETELTVRLRWILPAILAMGLVVLCSVNLLFYFNRYYADSESLKSNAYRSAQRNYEVQTVQSRYVALLSPQYQVFTVGQSPWPYDPVTTQYLVPEQTCILLINPTAELESINRDRKGLVFLFFSGNEQYRELTHELFPGGNDGEVTSRRGKHLFYTYVLTPSQAQAIQK
jgi:4-amino-4-deoxy-L-arabinose transferase-like glycosyltransferase